MKKKYGNFSSMQKHKYFLWLLNCVYLDEFESVRDKVLQNITQIFCFQVAV